MVFLRQAVAVIGAIFIVLSSNWAIAQTTKPVALSLASLTPVDGGIGVYQPNQPIVWNIRLSQAGTDTHVSFVVRDWQGNIEQEGHDLLASGGDLQIVCALKRLGWFELTVTLLDSSNHVQDKKMAAFSIEPQAHSAGKYFHYGISSHTAQYAGTNFEDEIRLLAGSGADIIRTDFSWNAIQPNSVTWNFQNFDKLVDALAAQRIEVQGILSYTARWATTGDPNDKDFSKWARAAPKLGPYVAFATTSVNRYKGRVQFWEIWNEPDIGFWQSSTERYIELFNATSKAIKQAAPDARVLNGGLAMVARQPNPNFIRDFLKGADTTHWDIWAYHDYQTFPQMLSRNSEHQRLYKSEGVSIPVWINEGGFHDLNTGGENEQAVTLVKKYTAAPALGVSAYFWYDLRDDGTDPKEPEHHFGLARHNFSPKPAFTAYQVLIDQVSNSKFAMQLTDVPAGVFAYLYRGGKANDENVLVLWREGKNRLTPVWLDIPVAAVSAYDIMGNPLPSVSYAAGSLLSIGDKPLYLHFRGASLVPKVEQIVSTPDKIVLARGAPAEVSVQVSNPSKRPKKTTLSLQSNTSGITFAPINQTLAIPPNQVTVFHSKALIQASSNSPSGTVTVRAEEAGSKHTIEAIIPYSTALVIPRLRSAPSIALIPPDQSLQLTLADRDHIHNLFNAEPSPEMHWHGPEDLSATARIAYDASALYLEADVRDDVHHQTHHDGELWQGDSLQFMIQTAEAQTDYFEALAALAGDAAEGWVLSKPVNSTFHLGHVGDEIPIAVRREGDHTIYFIRIPWKALGLASVPVDGFHFNFIVNDDDGRGRKQWVRISPGLGDEINPGLFNIFVCR